MGSSEKGSLRVILLRLSSCDWNRKQSTQSMTVDEPAQIKIPSKFKRKVEGEPSALQTAYDLHTVNYKEKAACNTDKYIIQ